MCVRIVTEEFLEGLEAALAIPTAGSPDPNRQHGAGPPLLPKPTPITLTHADPNAIYVVARHGENMVLH